MLDVLLIVQGRDVESAGPVPYISGAPFDRRPTYRLVLRSLSHKDNHRGPAQNDRILRLQGDHELAYQWMMNFISIDAFSSGRTTMPDRLTTGVESR